VFKKRPIDAIHVPSTVVSAVCGANYFYARVFHRTRVLTPCTLPARGAAILVCNHTSGLDPLLLQSATRRVIVWMMAREYFEIRALKRFFQLVDAIPVDRSGKDLSATRGALRALQNGRVLGIFPEGRIEQTRDLLPFQTGAAMLARRAGCPVVPAYITGTQRGKGMLSAFTKSQSAIMTFGGRMEFSRCEEKPDLETDTLQIESRIRELMHFVQGSPGDAAQQLPSP
jgi:1-acyl-sn-glycerol-3-phosphate acyltransferase